MNEKSSQNRMSLKLIVKRTISEISQDFSRSLLFVFLVVALAIGTNLVAALLDNSFIMGSLSEWFKNILETVQVAGLPVSLTVVIIAASAISLLKDVFESKKSE